MLTRHATALALAASLLCSVSLANANTPPGPQDAELSVRELIIDEAKASLVPPALALAVAKVESDFNPWAQSTVGAKGVMQIRTELATSHLGIDADELFEPRLNVQIGLDYLGQFYQLYGRWDLALSHYHSGGVQGQGANAKPLPQAQAYVDLVLRWHQRYAAQQQVWTSLEQNEAAVFMPSHSAVQAETATASTPKAAPVAAKVRPTTVQTTVEATDETAVVRWWTPPALDDFENIDEKLAMALERIDDSARFPAPGSDW